MRRPAQTILTRARKRSVDSENQPVALLRPGWNQHHFAFADAPVGHDVTTVVAQDSYREHAESLPVFATR